MKQRKIPSPAVLCGVLAAALCLLAGGVGAAALGLLVLRRLWEELARLAEALPGLIAAIRERGYQLARVDQLERA